MFFDIYEYGGMHHPPSLADHDPVGDWFSSVLMGIIHAIDPLALVAVSGGGGHASSTETAVPRIRSMGRIITGNHGRAAFAPGWLAPGNGVLFAAMRDRQTLDRARVLLTPPAHPASARAWGWPA
jgi:hypothetical protein